MAIEKVVSQTELEFHTQMGWEVVETVTRTEAVWATENTNVNGYQQYGVPVCKGVGSNSHFRVRKSEESVLAAKSAELSTAISSRDRAERELSKVGEELKEEKRKSESLTVRCDAQVKSLAAETARADGLRFQLAKIEKDLGKVRDEIGRAKFEEIVGDLEEERGDRAT